MSEPEKEDFLSRFTPDSGTIGFAVMGGIFGEGIDLKQDRLTNVLIVGVGIPQVNPEQNLIRDYYDHTFGNGFFYAFQMPGFCRVLQAAGRLIRTESDRGWWYLSISATAARTIKDCSRRNTGTLNRSLPFQTLSPDYRNSGTHHPSRDPK